MLRYSRNITDYKELKERIFFKKSLETKRILNLEN